MLRRGVIQRKTIGMFFHEGESEFALGGGPNLRRGGSAFAEGGVRIWSRRVTQDKVYFFRNKSRLN